MYTHKGNNILNDIIIILDLKNWIKLFGILCKILFKNTGLFTLWNECK